MKQETLSKELNSKIKNVLKNENFSQEQISVICNKYITLTTKNDLKHPKYTKPDFKPLLSALSKGYMLDEAANINDLMEKQVKDFKGFIKSQNLSLNEVYSLHAYSDKCDLILKFKRTLTDINKEYEILKKKFLDEVAVYAIYDEDLDEQSQEIENEIEKLDINMSFDDFKFELDKLYEKFQEDFVLSGLVMNEFDTFYRKAKKLKERSNHSTCITSALNNKIDTNTIVYRGITRDFLYSLLGNLDYERLVGQKIEDKGFTSTSLLYSSSFAIRDNFSVVFKIYAPKNTLGRNISAFSEFDEENEILFAANDMYILDCDKNYVDENNKKKILYTVLLLSKDRSCYNDLGKTPNKTEINDIIENS